MDGVQRPKYQKAARGRGRLRGLPPSSELDRLERRVGSPAGSSKHSDSSRNDSDTGGATGGIKVKSAVNSGRTVGC